jgi:hypothetical protein
MNEKKKDTKIEVAWWLLIVLLALLIVNSAITVAERLGWL